MKITKSKVIIGIFVLGISITQINLNPSGQSRKVGPWQDWDIPTDPDELAAYKFAHSIKLPDEPKPDNYFKEGLFGVFVRTTSDEYFKHLCETEAGEFIYKTVEDVEGIFQMRPRKGASSRHELQERYPMEDHYGYTEGEANEPEFMYVNPDRYQYIEIPIRHREIPSWQKKSRHPSYSESIPTDAKYRRFSGYDSREKETMMVEYTTELKSRYGYTWRGIRRPYDRENGIAGGELIILDLKSNEVLGVRRGFARTGRVPNNVTGISWEVTQVCPNLTYIKNWPKRFDFNYWFIGSVLKPIGGNAYTNGGRSLWNK